MELSNKNVSALLLDLNQDIEEYAEATVKKIIEDKNFDFLTYPPNNGLTDLEKQELNKLDNNKHLKNALRKVIADNSAGIIFSMLNIIDGTTDPKHLFADWTGVKLVDQEPNDEAEEFQDMLHDSFFETYWEWKKIRGDKKWKLDTYEE
ncbi:hypothetical protein QWZ08_17620 [Ferruginibacter paludis]|uniref:hypothetical protein n=1 Tax=Ferruginibacter paludis TaxID=1310417 RepID=UPI0025B294E7|nr:hypothetical protein [Ferruginibacter paludis]MDN3657476.1 hypothetical protein [Ferruginibacter paludis]